MPGLSGPAKRGYRAAPKYRDLKRRTRDDYEKHLPYFEDKLGHLTPRQIERHHVIRWRDAWAKHKSAHFANYCLRVLSIVMEHAKDMGLLTKSEENPAKGIKALKYEKNEREPWPDTLVAAFRKACAYGSRERTLFEMCLGTGQRIGDVLRMQWGHVRGDTILVIQGKTGTRLEIPLTRHLSAALEATERQSLFILTKDMSKTKRPGQWEYRGASDAMRAARAAIGAQDYDLHGLRYTAAVELLLADCSDDLISAVTGQKRRSCSERCS